VFLIFYGLFIFCENFSCSPSGQFVHICFRLYVHTSVFFVPEIYRLISRKTMADAGAAPTAAIPQGQGISLNAANVNAPEKKAGGCC